MQIHQLPEQQTVADADMFAIDTGQTTRRTPFTAIKTAISTFAHQLTNLAETTATSDSDVLPIDDGTGAKKIAFGNLKNKITESASPAFNSEDASSSVVWTVVSVLTSGETIPSILNKVSLMFKNIRFLYYKIGNNNVSGTGKSSLTAIIGNTSLVSIGNGTLSGAISAFNSEINTINNKIAWQYFTQSTEADFLSAVDNAIGTGSGFLFGYATSTTAAAAGLNSEAHYIIALANSSGSRLIMAIRPAGGIYTRYKGSGTWASGWRYVLLNALS